MLSCHSDFVQIFRHVVDYNKMKVEGWKNNKNMAMNK